MEPWMLPMRHLKIEKRNERLRNSITNCCAVPNHICAMKNCNCENNEISHGFIAWRLKSKCTYKKAYEAASSLKRKKLEEIQNVAVIE